MNLGNTYLPRYVRQIRQRFTLGDNNIKSEYFNVYLKKTSRVYFSMAEIILELSKPEFLYIDVNGTATTAQVAIAWVLAQRATIQSLAFPPPHSSSSSAAAAAALCDPDSDEGQVKVDMMVILGCTTVAMVEENMKEVQLTPEELLDLNRMLDENGSRRRNT